MQLPLKYDSNWYHLHEPCLERAIIICNAVASAIGNRRETIEEKIYQQLFDSKSGVFWKQLLARIILNNRPILIDKSLELGEMFNTHGSKLFKTDQFHLTQSCFEIASGFFSRAKDNDACISATACICLLYTSPSPRDRG